MASGNVLCILKPQDNEPPAASFATLDTRADVPVLDFDASASESAEFGFVLPHNYNGGGITVTVVWMASTATSGDVVWDIAFKSFTDDADDLDSKAYATANTATETTSSASGEMKYTDVTFTDGAQIDSVALREYCRLKVTRDVSDAADTMSGDAELVAIIIKET